LAADFTDIPQGSIRLLFNGRALQDARSLAEHNVIDGSVIQVVPLRPSPLQPSTFANFRGVLASVVRLQDTIARLLLSIGTLQHQLSGDDPPSEPLLSEFQALAHSSLSRVVQVRDEIADIFNPQPPNPPETPQPRSHVEDSEIEVPQIQSGAARPPRAQRPADVDEPEVPRVEARPPQRDGGGEAAAPARLRLILTEEELTIVNQDVEEMRAHPIVVHFDSLYRPGRFFEDNFDFT
jgi:hypothetical protein